MTDLLKKVEARIKQVTGVEPILMDILEDGFEFDVRVFLTDAQFNELAKIESDLCVRLVTYS